MPPRPHPIANPRLRSLVVALLMVALLGASLALAAFVSARRTAPANGMSAVQLPALSLRVPTGWQPVSAADLPPAFRSARVLAEPRADGRLLAVLPLGSAPKAQITDALRTAMQRLLPRSSLQSLQGTTRIWRNERMYGLVYMGLSTQNMRKHYLAVLTPDGSRFWAIYLSGPFRSANANLRQMNLEMTDDRELLQTILDSATPARPG